MNKEETKELHGSFYPEDPEKEGMRAVHQRIDFILREFRDGTKKLFHSPGTREITDPKIFKEVTDELRNAMANLLKRTKGKREIPCRVKLHS